MTDKDLIEQLQTIADIMEEMSDKVATKEDLGQTEIRINAKIENEITKRLDSLFDGYKLNHEKQYELEREFERRTAEMQAQIDNIQARLYMLEKKTAI